MNKLLTIAGLLVLFLVVVHSVSDEPENDVDEEGVDTPLHHLVKRSYRYSGHRRRYVYKTPRYGYGYRRPYFKLPYYHYGNRYYYIKPTNAHPTYRYYQNGYYDPAYNRGPYYRRKY